MTQSETQENVTMIVIKCNEIDAQPKVISSTEKESKCSDQKNVHNNINQNEVKPSQQKLETYEDKLKTVIASLKNVSSFISSNLKKDLNCDQDVEFVYRSIRKETSPEGKQKIISFIVDSYFVQILENVLAVFQEKQFEELKSIQGWPIYKKIFSISWIISDSSLKFCHQICGCPSVVNLLVENLQKLTVDCIFWAHESTLYTVKSILGIMHNIHRLNDMAREIFRKTSLINVLQQAVECQIDMVRAKSMIILSYIINETEIDALNADDKILKFLIDILVVACESDDHCSRKFGMCVTEIIQGLNNLCVNDENKLRLVKLGIVPLYQGLLTSCIGIEEQQQAVTGLWRLSFHPDNKPVMRQTGCLEALEVLKQSDDEKIKHAACGTLWELRPQVLDLEKVGEKDLTKDFNTKY